MRVIVRVLYSACLCVCVYVSLVSVFRIRRLYKLKNIKNTRANCVLSMNNRPEFTLQISNEVHDAVFRNRCLPVM